MMFSKAVLTFLTIGALWVNVSAIPIPVDSPPGPSSGGSRPTRGLFGVSVDSLQKHKGQIGELPRSFSALSYRDLTFVFSVAFVAGLGTLTAAGLALGLHNHTKTVSKREPMSEDRASDSLSSLLKRESEPAPPFL